MRSGRKVVKHARELRKRMTHAEVILWSRLRPLVWPFHRFRRQHPIGPYIADFACPLSRLVVEVDGATHGSDVERAYDRKRDGYMRLHGWQVVRVTNEDVYKYLNETLDLIARQAPPSSRRLRGGPPPP
ncbi:MAG: endonuclease domain-containing protein [Proteobacteria bacterium]|nr:endonuclease domain-containing protein [Pseudomonadota bacterium]